MPETVETIIVGVNCQLSKAGHGHLVLERGEIAETWRSQRWDSFKVNSPNRMNQLPGDQTPLFDPDGFWHRDEVLQSFESHASSMKLPWPNVPTSSSNWAASDSLATVSTGMSGTDRSARKRWPRVWRRLWSTVSSSSAPTGVCSRATSLRTRCRTPTMCCSTPSSVYPRSTHPPSGRPCSMTPRLVFTG